MKARDDEPPVPITWGEFLNAVREQLLHLGEPDLQRGHVRLRELGFSEQAATELVEQVRASNRRAIEAALQEQLPEVLAGTASGPVQ